jgi:hypothetical protein
MMRSLRGGETGVLCIDGSGKPHGTIDSPLLFVLLLKLRDNGPAQSEQACSLTFLYFFCSTITIDMYIQ